ncbi:hypothetical protein [Butyricicoccus sp.]|uniref:hypothetical protein n=1 Tax=Butyricicoccus sp. TaxID=2049021 RepID=UPI0037350067
MGSASGGVPARCTEITPDTAPGEAKCANVAKSSAEKSEFCKEIEGITRFSIEELRKIAYNIAGERWKGTAQAEAGRCACRNVAYKIRTFG